MPARGLEQPLLNAHCVAEPKQQPCTVKVFIMEVLYNLLLTLTANIVTVTST